MGKRRLIDAAWSPTDPQRLAFSLTPQEMQARDPTIYLFDLDFGPIYTATQSWIASWSADGNWVALGRQGRVTVTNPDRRKRYEIEMPQGDWCIELAWNPAADLSDLDN